MSMLKIMKTLNAVQMTLIVFLLFLPNIHYYFTIVTWYDIFVVLSLFVVFADRGYNGGRRAHVRI